MSTIEPAGLFRVSVALTVSAALLAGCQSFDERLSQTPWPHRPQFLAQQEMQGRLTAAEYADRMAEWTRRNAEINRAAVRHQKEEMILAEKDVEAGRQRAARINSLPPAERLRFEREELRYLEGRAADARRDEAEWIEHIRDMENRAAQLRQEGQLDEISSELQQLNTRQQW